MRIKEYQYKPDVLDLLFKKEEYSDLTIKQIDTAFGKDENQYVYKGDTFLGIVVNAEKYYSGLEVKTNGFLTISLTPAIHKCAIIELPSVYDFQKCLNEIIKDNISDCILICERDCEQYEVEKYKWGAKKANAQVHQLFKFLYDGSVQCPTFLITR